MNNRETVSSTPEYKEVNHEALKQASLEQIEKLRENHEASDEHNHDDVEALNAAAAEQAAESEPTATEAAPAETSHRGPISGDERKASFNMTMSQTRRHMNAPSRSFSKVIHTKPVEKASEIGASTIARPNAILAGSAFAFVVTLGLYLITKNMGYRLSGFETIAGFALGWMLGLLFDYFRVMITGKKAS